jgi:hypothetical protein
VSDLQIDDLQKDQDPTVDLGAEPRCYGSNPLSEGTDDVVPAPWVRLLTEASGLLRAPYRLLPLIQTIALDRLRATVGRPNLYSYTKTKRSSPDALHLLLRWIYDAQRPDGGIAAYYSLLNGYSNSYPEVTGYIIPTLYDYAKATRDARAVQVAERATQWLLSLQTSEGAFPAGLYGCEPRPSVFNTGQILQGLVRTHRETKNPEVLNAAIAAGDWLIRLLQRDGSWSGEAAYQGVSHTYYSMVAWALAELSEVADHGNVGESYEAAAQRNLNWVLSHFRPGGWIDGLNLRGHPNYSHFIAYVLQGVLECGVLCQRRDAIQAVKKSASVLLRKFETTKFLEGAFETDFKAGHRFTCLTGNAQISCVWLRVYEQTGDLRFLNAALKMNEMLKELLPVRGGKGTLGGVSGSHPIWGRYQPLRYISWGCKFLADAMLLEQRIMQSLEFSQSEVLPCAS